MSVLEFFGSEYGERALVWRKKSTKVPCQEQEYEEDHTQLDKTTSRRRYHGRLILSWNSYTGDRLRDVLACWWCWLLCMSIYTVIDSVFDIFVVGPDLCGKDISFVI